MHRLILPMVAVILAVAVTFSDAICCGRGVHGFCKDCTTVKGIFSKGQKCCGSGSGRGRGCNIFCCNCVTCRKGKPKITYQSGWWFHKKHSCEKKDTESDKDLQNQLVTQEVFKNLDKDEDKALSPGEFLDGLRAHLNKDFDASYSMGSNLLQSDEREVVMELLDAAQTGQMDDEVADDIARIARDEFEKMDGDNDGLIQAKEFDKDLN